MRAAVPAEGGAAARPALPRRLLLLLLVAAPAFIAALGTWTDVDLVLADAVFDPASGAFPWRHAWLAEEVGHTLLKRVLVALGLGFVAAASWDAFSGRWPARRRFQLRLVALSAILVPATIALLKQASSSHCPWDLERYGGAAPYVRLLEALPAGSAPGHCMPGGHASSALWLVSLAVLFLPGRPRAAALCAGLLLAFGFAVGALQQLRGAHFLTHTLWSMWIAVVVVLALAALLGRRGAGAGQGRCLRG